MLRLPLDDGRDKSPPSHYIHTLPRIGEYNQDGYRKKKEAEYQVRP